MFAFACKGVASPQPIPEDDQLSASEYASLALEYVEDAMAECGDDVPPLCVLQALILTTHWMIIQGVRGRSWRYVGICIRVLFELRLHAIDADTEFESYATDPDRWCRDEEKRRAFWAVWEMDQYASHIKHLPITSDWTRDGVHLPAEDERWFAGHPQRSCALAPDLIDRCKNLKATGSRSGRAWYIVIASFNAVAYDIVYSRSHSRRLARGQVSEIAHRWPTLFNTLQLSSILLPQELRFHGQCLDFGTQTMGLPPNAGVFQRHSDIFEIALMPEVLKMVILRPYVFDAYMRTLLKRAQQASEDAPPRTTIRLAEELVRKVEQCFNAADSILNLIVNCHESYYRYVNPYVAQVPWVAATVQLLHQELTEDEAEKQLIRSKLEIFKATNEKSIQHWNMSQIPRENLAALESRLKQFTAASHRLMSRGRIREAPANNPAQLAHASTATNRFNEEPSINKVSPRKRNRPGRSSGVLNTNTDSTKPSGGEQRHSRQSRQMEMRDADRFSAESPSSDPRSTPPIQRLADPGLNNAFQHLPEQFEPPPPPPESTVSPQDMHIDIVSGTRELSSQYANIDSEPLDWLSIFSSTEIDAGLADYFDMFSAPYL